MQIIQSALSSVRTYPGLITFLLIWGFLTWLFAMWAMNKAFVQENKHKALFYGAACLHGSTLIFFAGILYADRLYPKMGLIALGGGVQLGFILSACVWALLHWREIKEEVSGTAPNPAIAP